MTTQQQFEEWIEENWMEWESGVETGEDRNDESRRIQGQMIAARFPSDVFLVVYLRERDGKVERSRMLPVTGREVPIALAMVKVCGYDGVDFDLVAEGETVTQAEARLWELIATTDAMVVQMEAEAAERRAGWDPNP